MSATRAPQRAFNHRIAIPVGAAVLTPTLTVPLAPRGLVVVPSASGDRTYERANRTVISALWEAGFTTVEVDLLLSRKRRRTRSDHRFVMIWT